MLATYFLFSQVIWKKTFGGHPLVQDIITLLFSAMKEYRLGKCSTVFQERARELSHLVLTNKKEQSTRFVASLARGMKTYFQNLPTIIMVMSQVRILSFIDNNVHSTTISFLGTQQHGVK